MANLVRRLVLTQAAKRTAPPANDVAIAMTTVSNLQEWCGRERMTSRRPQQHINPDQHGAGRAVPSNPLGACRNKSR
jgi:hypothetical protein